MAYESAVNHGSEAWVRQDAIDREVLPAQVRLLYLNAYTGVAVTVVAATVLGRLQWGTVPNAVVLGWWLYMLLVSASRFALARAYRHASPEYAAVGKWRSAFALGAGLAGVGWGGAAIVLYPGNELTNQVFLVFVLGGMMLGAATVLAPRPEAFLAFLIPAGFGPAVRLVLHGDETHVAMGLLAAVFTLATVMTTRTIYRTLYSSLKLQFENKALVDDLETAKNETEALNRMLELRVQERTAELNKSTEQLRAEIAQREKVEEELLRSRKLESLGVLAGGIAHDFNNFLTVIQGNLELTGKYVDAGEPVQEILAETAGACRRASLLSSQLLTFAKGGTPVRRVVSLKTLIRDAAQLVRAGAPIRINVEIAEDLRCARVDPGQIDQVLHNIILNAREAMPEGGLIEVRAENVAGEGDDADGWVRISITDYGPGIPAEALQRIFDPYFTTKPGGRGLGLATAYTIVAKHGGHISVESKPGEGSVFTVDLPATREKPSADVPNVAPVRTGSERILVMDDEEALRNLLKAVLSKFGYQVQAARDGAEAVTLFERAKAEGSDFDAVLLDLTVSGGMGGVEAALRLRELDPTVKLIVSSGYSDAAVMSEYERYGFDAVIPKPWAAADLSNVFRAVLGQGPDRKVE